MMDNLVSRAVFRGDSKPEDGENSLQGSKAFLRRKFRSRTEELDTSGAADTKIDPTMKTTPTPTGTFVSTMLTQSCRKGDKGGGARLFFCVCTNSFVSVGFEIITEKDGGWCQIMWYKYQRFRRESCEIFNLVVCHHSDPHPQSKSRFYAPTEVVEPGTPTGCKVRCKSGTCYTWASCSTK
eukprot:3788558-Rhodomonas_salina.1